MPTQVLERSRSSCGGSGVRVKAVTNTSPCRCAAVEPDFLMHAHECVPIRLHLLTYIVYAKNCKVNVTSGKVYRSLSPGHQPAYRVKRAILPCNAKGEACHAYCALLLLYHAVHSVSQHYKFASLICHVFQDIKAVARWTVQADEFPVCTFESHSTSVAHGQALNSRFSFLRCVHHCKCCLLFARHRAVQDSTNNKPACYQ